MRCVVTKLLLLLPLHAMWLFNSRKYLWNYTDLPVGHQGLTRRGPSKILRQTSIRNRQSSPTTMRNQHLENAFPRVGAGAGSFSLAVPHPRAPPPLQGLHTVHPWQGTGRSRVGVCLSCHPLKCPSYHLEWCLTCRDLVLLIFSFPTTYKCWVF